MKPEILQQSIPDNLAQKIYGYEWQQIHLGLSPSNVFRLDDTNKNSLYLKISPRVAGFSLLREKMVLDWLQTRLPVPKVLTFDKDENSDYLLLSAIRGAPASDDLLKDSVEQVIENAVEGLKIIHELPFENCAFEARLDFKIALAQERMLKGLVDESDFDEERQGKTAEEIFRELIETKPADEDLVFTHGDYCLPNVILENGKLSGFVDWGNAGVADKYQDLALLTRSIRYNFGKEWEGKAFEIYGIDPDSEKINFYRLLDEFF